MLDLPNGVSDVEVLLCIKQRFAILLGYFEIRHIFHSRLERTRRGDEFHFLLVTGWREM